MTYLVIGIVFVSLVAASMAVLIAKRPRSANEPGGFRDWVKNPGRKRFVAERMAAMEEERRSLRAPENISDDEIGRIVARLFVLEDPNRLNYERVKLLGGKARSFLVRALDDPRVSERYTPKDEWHHGPKVPLERVCSLLQPLDQALVVRTLTGYIDHSDAEVRKYAAIVLGEIGTAECGDAVVQTLADADDYVRSYAMMGIGRSLKEGRCAPEFLDAVFPALVELLDRRDRSVGGRAPALVLKIDTDRALPILISPKYFTASNRELHYIIKALNAVGHRIPHDLLLPILEQLKPLIADYPYDYSYAESLKAYARNPDAAAEGTFRGELASTNERVQTAAAESLSILTGIGQPSRTVMDAVRVKGFDSLTTPQQRFFAVLMYDAEVNNGGHSQYFVNSTGNSWPIALAGLGAIGATGRAAILREAVGLFGPKGAPLDNGERHERLARFSKRQDGTLDDLDKRYSKSKENVESLLTLYAIDNKEAFRVAE